MKFIPSYLKDVNSEEHTDKDVKPTILEDGNNFDPLRPLSEIRLKPEDQLPTLVPISDLRLPYIRKMNSRKKKLTCILCGREIKISQQISWWLNIYPAHLDCIHAELNRMAAQNEEPIPFPEE